MTVRASRVCPCIGCPAHDGHSCPNLVPIGTSRCPDCASVAEHTRGSAHRRGYGARHAHRFRRLVLRRDPLCTCEDLRHGHGAPCLDPSTTADHYPLTKKQLRKLGLDEHDPSRGRGLCTTCHNKHTAHTSPGGFAARHTQ